MSILVVPRAISWHVRAATRASTPWQGPLPSHYSELTCVAWHPPCLPAHCTSHCAGRELEEMQTDMTARAQIPVPAAPSLGVQVWAFPAHIRTWQSPGCGGWGKTGSPAGMLCALRATQPEHPLGTTAPTSAEHLGGQSWGKLCPHHPQIEPHTTGRLWPCGANPFTPIPSIAVPPFPPQKKPDPNTSKDECLCCSPSGWGTPLHVPQESGTRA